MTDRQVHVFSAKPRKTPVNRLAYCSSTIREGT